MLDEEGNEPDEGVQRVETFGTNQSGAVRLFTERSVAQVHAHLGTQAEKASYQVVRLQNSLGMHLE